MKTRHKIIRFIAAVLAVVFVLWLCQCILMPKYTGKVREGNLVKEYYGEKDKNFDLLFIGDCEVYENFSPEKLWEDYGINSYIRGSAEQYIWQSYYLLEETIKHYHTPEAVVFNIQSLQFNESHSEAYNRMTIDGMKWSSSKVGAIKASMKENEHFIDYVFPILRFHSRWDELNGDDFRYMFGGQPKVSFNGYYMRVDTRPVTVVPKGAALPNYHFGSNAWYWLDRIRKLCDENHIQLILIKAPSLYPYWYPQYEEQVEAYAEKYQLPYYNFIELAGDAGIDYTTDTYDAGQHLNLSGAEKMSAYFGKILSEKYHVTDRRGDQKLEKIWAGKKKAYEAEIRRQCKLYNVKLDRKEN